MSESWWLRAGRRAHVVRLLLWPTCSHRSSTHASLTSLVSRVVEQGSNVVDEERVKQLCNSLFVREIQRAVEGYPVIVVSPARKEWHYRAKLTRRLSNASDQSSLHVEFSRS